MAINITRHDLEVTNLKYAGSTLIDVTVALDGQSFPFTYAPNDAAPVSVAVRALLAQGGHTIAAYVAQPPPVPKSISDRQFFHALALMGAITQQEALDAVSIGAIPAAIMTFVNSIENADEKFAAKMLLSGAIEFRRTHPLVTQFGAAMGWTSAQIDALWITAAAL